MRNGILLTLVLAGWALPPAQAPESLLIGPGDLLHIQVFDTPELEQHARVTDAGGAFFNSWRDRYGESHDARRSRPAPSKRRFVMGIISQPQVAVTVDEYATERVSVLGEVKMPGAYAIQTPRSVLDVLSLAGWLTDLADRKILIERKETKEKTPYFVSNDPKAALDTSVQVYPGDTLVVPKAGILYALGDVGRPGGYTMTNNESQISVLELVARAGGTNHTAVPSHAVLIRKNSQRHYPDRGAAERYAERQAGGPSAGGRRHRLRAIQLSAQRRRKRGWHRRIFGGRGDLPILTKGTKTGWRRSLWSC